MTPRPAASSASSVTMSSELRTTLVSARRAVFPEYSVSAASVFVLPARNARSRKTGEERDLNRFVDCARGSGALREVRRDPSS